jgi:hypothetical protein
MILPDGSWNVWISTPTRPIPAQLFVPYFEHRSLLNEDEMISSGKDFLAGSIPVEEKNSFFRHFFENTVARNSTRSQEGICVWCKGFIRSSVPPEKYLVCYRYL